MNKYEIMFIVKATMESADVKKCAETYKKLISDLKGKVVEYKELGSKKLAYPIKKELNGVKVLGNGKLEKAITVKAHKFSKSAVASIEAAGGKTEVI